MAGEPIEVPAGRGDVAAAMREAREIEQRDRRVDRVGGERWLFHRATIAVPLVGDPFVARGQVEVAYRFR